MPSQDTHTQNVTVPGSEAGTLAQEVGQGAASVLEGAGLVVVSPIVVPALLLGLRPVAKTVIKGSLFVTDMLTQLATATTEGWSTLLAEARAGAQTALGAPQPGPVTPHTAQEPLAGGGRAEGDHPRIVPPETGLDTLGTPQGLVDAQGQPLPQADQRDVPHHMEPPSAAAGGPNA